MFDSISKKQKQYISYTMTVSLAYFPENIGRRKTHMVFSRVFSLTNTSEFW